jgi:sulfotransferase family protein
MTPAPFVPVAVKRSLQPGARRFRQATRNRRILPSVLIIGAQRAGTTSLFELLRDHPDFCAPRSAYGSIQWPKELHFFDENFDRGLDWYRAFFPLGSTRARRRARGSDLVGGEATPTYLFHPAVPARVAATLPAVRLVAVLRDPVQRAFSQYQRARSTGRETLSFEEAIEREPQRIAGVEEWLSAHAASEGARHPNYLHYRRRAYVSRGYYADQLARWLEHFPREQLLVLRAEDLFARTQETFSEVLRFARLGDSPPTSLEPHNRRSYAPMRPETRQLLEALYAAPNARLAELLGWREAWGARTGGRRSSAASVGRGDAA